jgi:hypothetical protein
MRLGNSLSQNLEARRGDLEVNSALSLSRKEVGERFFNHILTSVRCDAAELPGPDYPQQDYLNRITEPIK